MGRINGKGTILIHALIMTVIVALIAASMAAVMMMEYRAVHRVKTSNQTQKVAHESLSELVSIWNTAGAAGQPCSILPGLTFSGTVGTCGCYYHIGGVHYIDTSGSNDNCQLTIIRPLPSY